MDKLHENEKKNIENAIVDCSIWLDAIKKEVDKEYSSRRYINEKCEQIVTLVEYIRG